MPKRQYAHHRKYGGGTIAPTPYGTFRALYIKHGQRRRASFKTEAEAETWIDAVAAELDTGAKPLAAWQLREAQAALALLPAGTSLVEVARFWAARHHRPSVKLSKAVEDFLDEKKAAGIRTKTEITYGSLLGALSRQYGEKQVAELTGHDLLVWLSSLKISATTRDNYRRTLFTFCAWCVKMGYLDHNPTGAITKTIADERQPEAFTPREVARLLHAAERDDPRLVPYLALAVFGGIRPDELARLDWSAVDLEAGHVHIGAAVAKVRRRRYVHIAPNLKAWLERYPGQGKIVPFGMRNVGYVIEELRHAAKIECWPPDVLRHSYATYHIALHKDAAATALEMGNSPAVIFRHYRKLATEAQGRRFFKILPGKNTSKKKVQ